MKVVLETALEKSLGTCHSWTLLKSLLGVEHCCTQFDEEAAEEVVERHQDSDMELENWRVKSDGDEQVEREMVLVIRN